MRGVAEHKHRDPLDPLCSVPLCHIGLYSCWELCDELLAKLGVFELAETRLHETLCNICTHAQKINFRDDFSAEIERVSVGDVFYIPATGEKCTLCAWACNSATRNEGGTMQSSSSQKLAQLERKMQKTDPETQ
jgi:hypothetical protein